MPQYYKAAILDGFELKVIKPSGESLLDQAMSTDIKKIEKNIYKSPKKIVWAGDYCNNEIPNFPFSNKEIWETKECELPLIKLELKNCILVNHSLRCYVPMDFFRKPSSKDEEYPHPLPLLTAYGNGLGSGGYYGYNRYFVGQWIGHVISVEDSDFAQRNNYVLLQD